MRISITLRRLWRAAPQSLKNAVRGLRYSLLRLRFGETVAVRFNFSEFKVLHASIDEYRSAKRFLDFEPEFLEAFLTNAEKASVVYDIGGYIGMYSLAAACCNANVKVFCFEPQPENCNSIQRNARVNHYDSINVFRVALGDQADSVVAFEKSGQTGRISASGVDEQTVSSPLSTLDHIATSEELPPPDLIKIDVEGYEAHVLRGMERIIRDHRPIILVEIHREFLINFGESESEIDRHMASYGYVKTVLNSVSDPGRSGHSQSHVAFSPIERNDNHVERNGYRPATAC